MQNRERNISECDVFFDRVFRSSGNMLGDKASPEMWFGVVCEKRCIYQDAQPSALSGNTKKDLQMFTSVLIQIVLETTNIRHQFKNDFGGLLMVVVKLIQLADQL
jgi:hypothetical protein